MPGSDPLLSGLRRAFRRNRVRRAKLIPFASRKNALRYLYVNQLYQRVAEVPGTLVECGVASGRTLLMLAFVAAYHGQKRHIYGFDTFAGLPEPGSRDGSAVQGRGGTILVEEFETRRYLEGSGLEPQELSRIHLVKGDIRETLPRYQGGDIALLHIDVDLYEGYRCALDQLFPRVSPGGAVLFDEYRDPKWPGATRAIDEYFGATTDEFGKDAATGKYYFITPQTGA